jgi:hypothetical protein
MKFYLGPFEHLNDEMGERWSGPAGARLIFDFRPLPSQSDYVYRDRPYALFAADTLGSEYDLLGEGSSLQDVLLTQSAVDLISQRIGVIANGDTLFRGILDVMQRGDPSGGENHRPLKSSLFEGEAVVNSTERILDVVRYDIREGFLRDQESGPDQTECRKCLGAYCEKYNIDDWRSLLLPDILEHHESPLPPTTVISDKLNSLGDFTAQSGTWSASGGLLKKTGAGDAYDTIYHDTSLSSVDHYCVVNGNASTTGTTLVSGPMVRHPGNANTGYWAFEYKSGSTYYVYLSKIVGGTRTDLTSSSMAAHGSLAVRADGSDVRAWRYTITVQTTDSSITSGQKVGAAQYYDSATAVLDGGFEAGDPLDGIGGAETVNDSASFNTSWSGSFSQTNAYNTNGDFRASGSGMYTAAYAFTVTSGNNYKVSATWQPHSNRATDTPYTVSGIAGGNQTVDVDQEAPPDDFVRNYNASYCPRAFKTLGTYEADGTTLTVTITDNANGYVIADAVLIEDLGAASSVVPLAIHQYQMAGGL